MRSWQCNCLKKKKEKGHELARPIGGKHCLQSRYCVFLVMTALVLLQIDLRNPQIDNWLKEPPNWHNCNWLARMRPWQRTNGLARIDLRNRQVDNWLKEPPNWHNCKWLARMRCWQCNCLKKKKVTSSPGGSVASIGRRAVTVYF